MVRNGWNVEIESTNENVADQCSPHTFHGHSDGTTVGYVSAIFSGIGTAILAYGNCDSDTQKFVRVLLNGNVLQRCGGNTRRQISFSYNRGDVVRLEETKSIIEIRSLELHPEGTILLLQM